jgi:hypothetical protein
MKDYFQKIWNGISRKSGMGYPKIHFQKIWNGISQNECSLLLENFAWHSPMMAIFLTRCAHCLPSTSIFISFPRTHFRQSGWDRCQRSAPSHRHGHLSGCRRWVQAQAEAEARRPYEN